MRLYETNTSSGFLHFPQIFNAVSLQKIQKLNSVPFDKLFPILLGAYLNTTGPLLNNKTILN